MHRHEIESERKSLHYRLILLYKEPSVKFPHLSEIYYNISSCDPKSRGFSFGLANLGDRAVLWRIAYSVLQHEHWNRGIALDSSTLFLYCTVLYRSDLEAGRSFYQAVLSNVYTKALGRSVLQRHSVIIAPTPLVHAYLMLLLLTAGHKNYDLALTSNGVTIIASFVKTCRLVL
jgi:hypothetical protein